MVKILADPVGLHAVAYHRMMQPLYLLQQQNIDIQYLGESKKQIEQFEWADIIFTQCMFSPNAYSFYNKLVRQGKRLILDYDDDYFNIPDSVPEKPLLINYKEKKTTEVSSHKMRYWVKAFLRLADTVIVTTEELKTLYEPYCEKIIIIPNYVSHEMNRDIPKKINDKVKIFWSGSSSHLPDLALLKKPLNQIYLKNKDKVEFHFQSNLDFESVFSDIPKITYPAIGFDEYLNLVQSIDVDIALAPLIKNSFNECKSNLKFLQMSLMEASFLASDVGPYAKCIRHGVNGFLAKTEEDWINLLQTLIDDESMRFILSNNAKKFVTSQYMIENNIQKWRQVLVG